MSAVLGDFFLLDDIGVPNTKHTNSISFTFSNSYSQDIKTILRNNRIPHAAYDLSVNACPQNFESGCDMGFHRISDILKSSPGARPLRGELFDN